MAASPTSGFLAGHRFGYGGSASGPRSAEELLRELKAAAPIPEELSGIESASRLRDEGRRRRESQAAKAAGKKATSEFKLRNYYRADAHARMHAVVASKSPFFERLVAFWSNHFTVSLTKANVGGLAGPYEIEAIRPNLRGRFEELLIAVETHPAMLIYLDQNQSIGPNSKAGQKRGKGLNENLAREILELHTLGVHGGYTQADTTSFARIMTGWTVNFAEGAAAYVPRAAEPGTKTLLGRSFGVATPRREDYLDALRFISGHRATARHIATKLVTHFIADDPPEAAIAAVEQAFLRSHGDLMETYGALLATPEAWQPELRKARNDDEFVIACQRAAGISKDRLGLPAGAKGANPLTVAALNRMQQRLWAAPSPAGWPEQGSAWLSPTGLAQRLAYIQLIVPEIHDREPVAFLERILADLASSRTTEVVSSASNREEGLALVLASPEFNRR